MITQNYVYDARAQVVWTNARHYKFMHVSQTWVRILTSHGSQSIRTESDSPLKMPSLCIRTSLLHCTWIWVKKIRKIEEKAQPLLMRTVMSFCFFRQISIAFYFKSLVFFNTVFVFSSAKHFVNFGFSFVFFVQVRTLLLLHFSRYVASSVTCYSIQ